MKEGEPVFGGNQANLGGTQPPNIDSESNKILSSSDAPVGFIDNKPKTPKKTIITFIFIITIVLIGIVTFFIIKNNKNDIFNSTTKSSYNQYANYLLYNIDSNAEINEEFWTSEKIEENLNNKNTEYFSNLLNLYDAFEETFYTNTKQPESLIKEPEDLDESEEIEEDSENEDTVYGTQYEERKIEYVYSLVYNIGSSLEKLKSFNDISKIPTNEMIKIFIIKGEDSLIEEINNTYGELSNSEDQLSDYGTLKIEIAKLIPNLYHEYNDAGCIRNEELLEECLSSVTLLDAEKQNQNQKFIQYLYDVDHIEYHIADNIITLSHSLYKELGSTGEQNE